MEANRRHCHQSGLLITLAQTLADLIRKGAAIADNRFDPPILAPILFAAFLPDNELAYYHLFSEDQSGLHCIQYDAAAVVNGYIDLTLASKRIGYIGLLEDWPEIQDPAFVRGVLAQRRHKLDSSADYLANFNAIFAPTGVKYSP